MAAIGRDRRGCLAGTSFPNSACCARKHLGRISSGAGIKAFGVRWATPAIALPREHVSARWVASERDIEEAMPRRIVETVCEDPNP
jgi:hypothetical protein